MVSLGPPAPPAPPPKADVVEKAPTEIPTPPEPERKLDVHWLLRMATIVILLGAFATFIMQNTETVDVEFLWWDFQASLIILLVGSAIVGMLLGALGGVISRRRRREHH